MNPYRIWEGFCNRDWADIFLVLEEFFFYKGSICEKNIFSNDFLKCFVGNFLITDSINCVYWNILNRKIRTFKNKQHSEECYHYSGNWNTEYAFFSKRDVNFHISFFSRLPLFIIFSGCFFSEIELVFFFFYSFGKVIFSSWKYVP
jgi:hypothetical protein